MKLQKTPTRKTALFIVGIFLLYGIVGWLLGGSARTVLFCVIAPKHTLPIAVARFLWFFSFALSGYLFTVAYFSRSLFCDRKMRNTAFLILLAHVTSSLAYPIFFGAFLPFLCFLLLFMDAVVWVFVTVRFFGEKIFPAVMSALQCLFLVYNVCVALGFAIVN